MLVKEKYLDKMKNSIGKIKTEKAELYVQRQSVKISSIELMANNKIMVVKGYILQSINKTHITVRINMEDAQVYGYTCDCNPYSYRECEHQLAILLELTENEKYENKIRNEIYGIKKQQETSIINTIIDQVLEEENKEFFDSEKNLNTEKNLKLIPCIEYAKGKYDYNLGFKLGNNKLYRMRDIGEFYDLFAGKQVYEYGKELNFEHVHSNVHEDYKQILDFILSLGKGLVIANNSINEMNIKKKISTSYVKFANIIVDEFFGILNGNIEFEVNGVIHNVEVKEDEKKIQFILEKVSEDEYKLMLIKNNYNIFIGSKNIYLLDNNNLYAYDSKKYFTLFKFAKSLDETYKKELVFSKKELVKFCSTIMPKISKNVELKGMTKTDIDKYMPKPLGVKIYLDTDKKENITAIVNFCYDEVEFNPLANEEVVAARDNLKENMVKLQLKKDGFYENTIEEKYILVKEEDIYYFITEKINKYMEKYEVLVSEEFKKKEVRQPKLSTFGVRIKNDLLSINLDGFNFSAKELKDILEKYKLKKEYYKLKDGTFINLDNNKDIEFVKNLKETLGLSYEKIAKGEVEVPLNRSLYLNKLLKNIDSFEIEEDSLYKDLISNIENGPKDSDIVVPDEVANILRPYQKTGFKWLKTLDHYRFGGILADDMGLGKTLQIITLLLSEKNKVTEPSIVICPSSLTLNWKNEIEKYAPTLKAIVVKGVTKDRQKIIKNIKKYDVIISSYDSLKRDIEEYVKSNCSFRFIIADEAQYIKNSNTQNAKALKQLVGQTRFALTGTPIENSLSELWSIFDYIMPGYLYSYSKFKSEIETSIVREDDDYSMHRLKAMIEPFILRREKAKVLTELPDKTVTIMKNEMESEQEKLYLTYMAQAKEEMHEELKNNGYEKTQIKILALLTRLRQICCHPSLFVENYKGESSKFNQCLEIINDAVSAGHKILVFSSYTKMFDIMQKELEKRNIGYYTLTGNTKIDERVEKVDEFNKNKNIKVYLISLKAGGTGLNLTGADMVIHYDPWWNISAENQATDRAYRIGQKNNVQVYKLITKNSIEEKIGELQEQKAKMIENVLDTNQTFINKLSKEDLMSLFE